MIGGQLNLRDADRSGALEFTRAASDYRLDEETATLLVRPRGWHLAEQHLTVDGEPVAGAFLDFGLYFFHNAQRLLDTGRGPYFYLPKTGVATSRRGCGTTSSARPRTGSGSPAGRSRPRC